MMAYHPEVHKRGTRIPDSSSELMGVLDMTVTRGSTQAGGIMARAQVRAGSVRGSRGKAGSTMSPLTHNQ